jgi:hypothetical protein
MVQERQEGERREVERYPVMTETRISWLSGKLVSGEEWGKAFILSVSVEGLFLKLDSLPDVGDLLNLELPIFKNSDEIFVVQAVVQWISEKDSLFGCGVSFKNTPAVIKKLIVDEVLAGKWLPGSSFLERNRKEVENFDNDEEID